MTTKLNPARMKSAAKEFALAKSGKARIREQKAPANAAAIGTIGS